MRYVALLGLMQKRKCWADGPFLDFMDQPWIVQNQIIFLSLGNNLQVPWVGVTTARKVDSFSADYKVVTLWTNNLNYR